MKFSIITPCLNAEKYILETVSSVLEQTAVRDGSVELEYLVLDGGSSDGTQEAVLELDAKQVRLVSEKDGGMYEALAKGLRLVSGDVVAYLNAGDYYNKYAFEIVRGLFAERNVRWLTGLPVLYNELGYIVDFNTPYIYRGGLFASGRYGRGRLHHLQQESTFWARELHETLDLRRLASFRLAGDYYLWTMFSKNAVLHQAWAVLGGFRRHPGQLSSNLDAYLAEVDSFTRSPSLGERLAAKFDAVMRHAPLRLKKALNPRLFVWDSEAGTWR